MRAQQAASGQKIAAATGRQTHQHLPIKAGQRPRTKPKAAALLASSQGMRASLRPDWSSCHAASS
jgi:hypothetical protein